MGPQDGASVGGLDPPLLRLLGTPRVGGRGVTEGGLDGEVWVTRRSG